MRRYITALMALMVSLNASAQLSSSELTNRMGSRGILLNRDILSIADMGDYSESNLLFGSARSMGLAGAITSLGGDATSMMVNPAGLGMARGGEFSFTPIVSIESASTHNGSSYIEGNNTTMALSNFATVFNLTERGEGKLIAVNMGIGYNRVTDLNYNYSFASMDNSSSIARLFSRQLTAGEISLDELYGSKNPDWSALSTTLWGAALGYKGGLTDYVSEDGIWNSTWIDEAASVDQYMEVVSEGSIGEFDIALGANISNKLYLGVTLGVQSLYHRLDLYYGEEYDNGDSLSGGDELYYTNYNQAIINNGSGVNIKVGATYRPTTELRLGLAYHSPTWYTVERQYQGSLATKSLYDGAEEYISESSDLLEDYGENSWYFRTSSRLLLGGSYTFGMRGLVSVDYQHDWRGSMKMRQTPYGVSSELYGGISDIYGSVGTLRVGAEYKFTPQFAIRGGWGRSSSRVRDGVSSAELLDMPTIDKVQFFTAGVGYSLSRFVTFDVTYMQQRSDYSAYTLFYSDTDVALPVASSAQSQSFSTKIKQQNIALSMVIKM